MDRLKWGVRQFVLLEFVVQSKIGVVVDSQKSFIYPSFRDLTHAFFPEHKGEGKGGMGGGVTSFWCWELRRF